MENLEKLEIETRINKERDSLLLFLAAKLNSYEWVQHYYPAFYDACLKAMNIEKA